LVGGGELDGKVNAIVKTATAAGVIEFLAF